MYATAQLRVLRRRASIGLDSEYRKNEPFVASLALLLVRPRSVSDWPAALGGGVLLVALDVLPVGAAV
jgi:hypothetical protein